MKLTTLTLLAASLLVAAQHTWIPAKVLDFSTEKVPHAIHSYINVATNEFIYTVVIVTPVVIGRTILGTPNIGPKGCRFIVNDNIQVEEDKNHKTLYMLDADGKQCKAEIFRQERASGAALNWALFGEGNGMSLYYDPNSVKYFGEIAEVYVWEKNNPPNCNTYVRMQLDHKDKTWRAVSAVSYDKDNKKTEDNEPTDWTSPAESGAGIQLLFARLWPNQ